MIRKNILKEKLQKNEPVFGPFARINSAAALEILGYAGFDFVILDTEHGPLDTETVENLVRAAIVSGITPIVRVRENNESLILRALDTGAQGVQVPQIVSRDTAERALQSFYYYPEGKRGVCRYVRSASYSHTPKQEYFKNMNREVLAILMIEGKEGLDSLEDILSLQGLDIVFFGSYDLSQSLGVPGQVDSKIVKDAVKHAIGIAKKHNVVVGTFSDSVQAAREWLDLGVQYISYSVDTGIYYAATSNVVNELHQILKKGV